MIYLTLILSDNKYIDIIPNIIPIVDCVFNLSLNIVIPTNITSKTDKTFNKG